MGFGLLLIGYIFAFVSTVGLGNYLFAGMLLGGFIIYLGLNELKKYSPTFIYAIIVNIFFLLCAFYETLVWADTQLLLGLAFSGDAFQKAFDIIEIVVNLLFNLTILYGIADLSKRVDFPETKGKAYRNMFFVGLFNLLQILMLLPIKIFDSDKSFFMTLLIILQVIYSLLNAFLIFKCYAMICPVGQEDMPRKKSKFSFVNKVHEKIDERERQAIEASKKYYEEKSQQRKDKIYGKSSSNNKKKK